MSDGNSIDLESPSPEYKENWLDLDDSTSLPSISLDEALLQLDQLDDALIFGESVAAEDESLYDGASFSGHSSHKEATTSTLRYTIDCPLSWRKAESISHQMASSEAKIGRPKAIAFSGTKLAIVTSKGALLILEEATERLVCSIFGDPQLGSASCVTFSEDGSHLAIGYSKGAIKIVTSSSGSTVATVHEAAQTGRGILQTIFLTRRKTVLVLDSGGSVFEVRLKKNITGKSKETIVCVFSGCNGEVVLMRYVRQYQLLILVTLTKILILSTNHGGSVLSSIGLQGPPNIPPLCDFHINQELNTLKICAVRGRSLSVYNLYPRRPQSRKSRFAELVATIEVPSDLVALSFLGENFIWCVDMKEQVGVVDLTTRQWLPLNSSQSPLQLVYATSDFKGLATGVNVSAALSCLAETCCYPSIAAQNGTVFVLGVSIYRYKILNELEIIESFRERKNFGSAALYALDLTRGKYRSQVKNLQSVVKARVPELLKDLLDWTLDGLSNGKVADLVAHYRKHIDILLKVCHQGDRMDFFYTKAYPRIEADSLARTVMFELLDERVLDGALADPPPTLVADYLTNLLYEGHFSQLQASIMRLPIYSIDIHWVMSTCRQNRLFDGIIYISNKALFDFISPLEEMFTNIASFSGRDLRSDSEIEIGNKLLLYLHCCLAGRAYPFGNLPPNLEETVPIEVYRCISSLHGKDGVVSGEKYPYLRQLLQFDAQQFFHVICTCADAPLFTTDCRLQRLLDILCSICAENGVERTLAQLIQCVSHLAVHARLLPQLPLLEDVVNSLLKIPNITEGSELSVVDLFRAVPDLSLQRPLQLAQRNPIKTKICSYILTTERRFIELMQCFFENCPNSEEVFSLISQILQLQLTADEYNQVNEFLRAHIAELTSLSSRDTAVLVIAHFPSHFISIRPIPGQSIENSLHHFPLLREAFILKRERNEHFLTMDDELDEELFVITFYGFIHKNQGSLSDLDEILKDWLQFWLPLGSKTDRCLNAAADKELTESCVLLLEARGFVERAFELLRQRLLIEAQRDELDEERLVRVIDRCVQFSISHRDSAIEGGWMTSLFEHVIALNQSTNHNYTGIRSRLLYITHKLLESDTSVAHQLLSALYKAPFFAEAQYGEHAELLNSILVACSYEERLLSSVHECQSEEIGEALFRLSKLTTHRLTRMADGPCIKCRGPIDKAAYVFNCGHLIHMECDERGQRMCPCQSPAIQKYPKFSSRNPLKTKRKPEKRDIFLKWDDPMDCAPSSSKV